MDDLLVKAHLDNNGQDLAIEHVQDVEDIIEWNKQARTEDQKSDWGRHIARIPDVIYLKWFDEEHAKGNPVRMYSKEFDEIVHKKLQDPEWAYLRTDKPALIMGWLGFGS